MTLALCIKCASQKFGALTACDGCGFAPKSEKEITQSLVYCDHILAKEVLTQLESEFKGRPLPDLEPEVEQKMAEATREARKMMGIADNNKSSAIISGARNKIRQLLRYVVSIVSGATAGLIVATGITMMFGVVFGAFGGEATIEPWKDKAAYIMMMFCKCFVTGCVAGWIAGKREKLIAALAHLFLVPPSVAFAMFNNMDAKISVWVWVGLIPAVLGGWIAKKTGTKGWASLLGILHVGFGFAIYLGASVVHLCTAAIAYKAGGLFATCVTLFLPVLSELYWFFSVWNTKGTIINGYDLAVLAVVAGFLLQVALAVWVAKSDNKRRIDIADAASAFFSHAEEGSDPWV